MSSLTVKKEATSLYDLKFWSGATANIEAVKEAGLETELFEHLCEVFDGGATDTEINDYVWFENKSWGSAIGLFDKEDVIRALIDYGDFYDVLSALENYIDVSDTWAALIDRVVNAMSSQELSVLWGELPISAEAEEGDKTAIIAELKRTLGLGEAYNSMLEADTSGLDSEVKEFIKLTINSAFDDDIKNVVEELDLDI